MMQGSENFVRRIHDEDFDDDDDDDDVNPTSNGETSSDNFKVCSMQVVWQLILIKKSA